MYVLIFCVKFCCLSISQETSGKIITKMAILLSGTSNLIRLSQSVSQQEVVGHGVWLKEVDVALLKLYAESGSSDLVPTLVSCCRHLSDAMIADCSDWLHRCGRHHAHGLLQHYHGDDAAALDVWTRHALWCCWQWWADLKL